VTSTDVVTGAAVETWLVVGFRVTGADELVTGGIVVCAAGLVASCVVEDQKITGTVEVGAGDVSGACVVPGTLVGTFVVA